MHPDGTVEQLLVPVSPPLGLGGGLPFESAEFTLSEGSRLVLYTDGVIEDRNRDIDTGLAMLHDALTGPGRTPEETCQAVLDALLPTRPSDDIALLVARSRLLDPSQVADWDTFPRRLRILRDGNNLICEVADDSSTSPHLRRATDTDEGGRGLFLVAQFTQRWGTRYMPRGKVIWSEQSLHSTTTEPDADTADALLDQWGDADW